jgi:hexosaminidase
VRLQKAIYTKGYNKNALSFGGKGSYAKLPYKEIGYNYTVSFWINPAVNNATDAVLFKSSNSTIKLKQGDTGTLGFSRDGYNFDFNYSVPDNTWTHIVITGTNKGTALYVNGKLHERLYDNFTPSDTDKTKSLKVKTVFFPLQTIGGFYGKLDELYIWNTVLSDEEIAGLK